MSEDVELLVVDDSSFNRLLLKRRLAELGYERVSMATNGREALDAMAATAFDVVLLDLEMPELDGIAVLEQLHASGRQEPPVIVISALSDMAGVVRCIELGAEDYLPKSFDPPLLRARLSAVLEKKRLRDLAALRLQALEAELESARQAQLSLVPHDFAGLGGGSMVVHGAMLPARQVGGDLYDAFMIDEEHLLFAVADVSGKGAPAALTMARSLGLIRATAREMAASGAVPDPGAILGKVNDDLVTRNEAMTFVTAIVGIAAVRTGEVRIANAGHDPAFLLTPGAAPHLLWPADRRPALGVLEDIAYGSERVELVPGGTLLLYTDGVTEAEDRAGEFYTRDRLLAHLAAAEQNAGPVALVQGVMRDVDRFAGGAAQADDITVLALRRAG